ncbi:Ig-like domain-containing protein [Chitinibacter bivalviorum]|uniref:Ig-like domain-containing protein n=1 Tax=Chitinibacter bivalviorum TaxID=2739434 RepID=A0A7H9BQK4_9NEIS|nr:Ig-like domain-containing protein [Chitinibacter bivalviorum]QLG89524.1 Ig-like domain-containing protein [Chitinibacter bivalviorum]
MSKAFSNIPSRQTMIRAIIIGALGTALTACGGSAGDIQMPGSSGPTPAPTGTAAISAAKLNLSWDKTSVKSGGKDKATLTITALDKSNGILAGATVLLSSSSGILSATVVTTDAKGQAIVTYTSGSDVTNRTENITVTSGTLSNTTAVKVIGTTVSLTSNNTSITSGGTSPLSATIKDGEGNVVPDVDVVFSASGTGSITFSPTSAKTDSNGVATTTATGGAGGTATVVATSSGTSKTAAMSIAGGSNNFSFVDQNGNPISSTVTNPNVNNSIQVATNASKVTFVTTLGTFGNGLATQTVNTNAGKAIAVLNSTGIGTATIQATSEDNKAITSSMQLIVSPAFSSTSKVVIQASPAVVAPSTGSQKNTITLKAKVTDSNGKPIANAPVYFTLGNSVGGGETISPPSALTGDGTGSLPLGEAQATFTSGSTSTGQTTASVTAVANLYYLDPVTNIQSNISNSSASIVIGGTAGSISIGESSVIGSTTDNVAYELPMSVIVADSNGNPMANTPVSLSVWPVYYSTGSGCAVSATYKSEDANENLVLEPSEEGGLTYNPSTIQYYPVTVVNSLTFDVIGVIANKGIVNGKLTPINSAAGAVPTTVTTDSSGRAAFKYTYLKSDSIWTVVRMRATTNVQGTETTAEKIFRLRASEADAPKGGTTCYISNSPYNAVIN